MSLSSEINTPFATAGLNAIPSPFPRIKAALLAALARRKARHAYACLLEADPHILNDIGITVADVRQAMLDNSTR